MRRATQEAPPRSEAREPSSASKSARFRAFLWSYGPAIAITLGAVGLGELIVRLANVPEFLIPTPSQVVADFGSDWPVLEPSLLVTLREIALGFAISVVAGIGLAVLLHLSPTARRAFYPILIGSQ